MCPKRLSAATAACLCKSPGIPRAIGNALDTLLCTLEWNGVGIDAECQHLSRTSMVLLVIYEGKVKNRNPVGLCTRVPEKKKVAETLADATEKLEKATHCCLQVAQHFQLLPGGVTLPVIKLPIGTIISTSLFSTTLKLWSVLHRSHKEVLPLYLSSLQFMRTFLLSGFWRYPWRVETLCCCTYLKLTKGVRAHIDKSLNFAIFGGIYCIPGKLTVDGRCTGYWPEAIAFSKSNCFKGLQTWTLTCYSVIPRKCYSVTVFLNRSLKELFELGKEHNLCINCLRAIHEVKTCLSKTNCLTCNSKHHTSLH
ncbi:hypothetical protein PR048_009856 [Dryococelus australis]|uniref:Uncharacterized protein n=1 Tax=Dryococelus australis TaxID=614101 RepID=A0ABQ9I2X8_9NEOP|nr:hypothetical protein PR048_009856 [Dryococelus australis]